MIFAAMAMLDSPNLCQAASISASGAAPYTHEAAQNVEMFGKNFAITIPGLPAGTYTLEIDATEYYHNAAGRRVMSVCCGDQVLASKIDLFQVAGQGKTHTIRAEVTHRGDFANGPLLITMSAEANHAKFNAVRVKDATGKIVAETTAAAIAKEQSAYGSEIPTVTGPEIWKDPSRKPEERAADLASRLSLQEKAAQIQMEASTFQFPVPKPANVWAMRWRNFTSVTKTPARTAAFRSGRCAASNASTSTPAKPKPWCSI